MPPKTMQIKSANAHDEEANFVTAEESLELDIQVHVDPVRNKHFYATQSSSNEGKFISFSAQKLMQSKGPAKGPSSRATHMSFSPSPPPALPEAPVLAWKAVENDKQQVAESDSIPSPKSKLKVCGACSIM